MANENPLWGTQRIRGELLKLGLVVSQAWRTFLANALAEIWAGDLFVVQTLTFRTLYVLFFIQHERRRLIHFNLTLHPTCRSVRR